MEDSNSEAPGCPVNVWNGFCWWLFGCLGNLGLPQQKTHLGNYGEKKTLIGKDPWIFCWVIHSLKKNHFGFENRSKRPKRKPDRFPTIHFIGVYKLELLVSRRVFLDLIWRIFDISWCHQSFPMCLTFHRHTWRLTCPPGKNARVERKFHLPTINFQRGMLFHEVEVEDLPEVFFSYCLANRRRK